MSGVEPGPNGTMILTGFVGHCCAAATAGANKSANNAKATLLFIELSRSARVIIRGAYLCVRVRAAIITGDAPSQAWSSRNRSGDSNGETQAALPRDLPWPLLPRLPARFGDRDLCEARREDPWVWLFLCSDWRCSLQRTSS